MKEFVLKGRLTLERVTFYVSAKTLEGALARAVNGDFDGYDTDAAESIDWRVALASIEENTYCAASRQCQLLCHNKSRALPCSAGPPRRAMPPSTLPVPARPSGGKLDLLPSAVWGYR